MPQPTRLDNLSALMTLGVHLPTRTLALVGEVDLDMVHRTLSGLQFIDGTEKDSITIKLSSPGGDMYSALAIYDAVRSCKSNVTIIGFGMVFSAATVILQAADERLLLPQTSLLIHQGLMEVPEATFPAIKAEIKEGERMRDRLCGILADKMKISLKTFLSRHRQDRYYTAEEAVKLGIADTIVSTF